jgi:glutamate/tyrosine decarboxylase-like PLP-dependent enzyme
MDDDLLRETCDYARQFAAGLEHRPVRPDLDAAGVRARLPAALPEQGLDAKAVIAELIAAAEGGLCASAGPRYFGFVVGGALPAALAADVLTSVWDQNACLHVLSPAAAAFEQLASDWLLQLLSLPSSASVGLVTGGQMANFTGLAAARNEVLRRVGWDLERDGLCGAPRVNVIVGAEAHATVFAALRMLGIGRLQIRNAAADEQGRMRVESLAQLLATCQGPTIVCCQVGNVNTGAFDPVAPIVELARAHGAWLHVDGAFGLWAGASERLAPLVAGRELADSWSVDGHKWLNVPQDTGFAIVADPEVHRAALGISAAYLQRGEHDPFELVPEWSRRARGFPAWAALRSRGRRGMAALIEGCCARAAEIAHGVAAEDGIEVLNDVVLNQVLLRFDGDDERTRAVIARVQADNEIWLGGSVWQGRAVMRVSVSSHATTEQDARRAAAAIVAAYRATR